MTQKLRMMWCDSARRRAIPDGLTAFASCSMNGVSYVRLKYVSEDGLWRLDDFHDGTAMRLTYDGWLLYPDCLLGRDEYEQLDTVINFIKEAGISDRLARTL